MSDHFGTSCVALFSFLVGHDMTASSVAALQMDVDTFSDRTISFGQSGSHSDFDILSNASEPEQQHE